MANEKDDGTIRKIIIFLTSFKARTIVGLTMTLTIVFLFYVLPYFFPKWRDFIANSFLNTLVP